MNLDEVLETVFQNVSNIEEQGELASYIPELANVDLSSFGAYISTTSHEGFGVGDFNKKFSIQSIAKVLSLCLAYKTLGENIWTRLGVEPSGTRLLSRQEAHAAPRLGPLAVSST